MFGIISYTILKLVSNKEEEVKLSLVILKVLFILKFTLL